MLEWASSTVAGVHGALVIAVGGVEITVYPKGTWDAEKHIWDVTVDAELVADGRSGMLNGAKEKALRAGLSHLAAKVGA